MEDMAAVAIADPNHVTARETGEFRFVLSVVINKAIHQSQTRRNNLFDSHGKAQIFRGNLTSAVSQHDDRRLSLSQAQ
jgi:hypothetical protein